MRGVCVCVCVCVCVFAAEAWTVLLFIIFYLVI